MEFLKQLTPYNLFNFLFPGVIFSEMLRWIWAVDVAGDNILISLFVYYFIGMVISRVGSLMVEPIAKRVAFVRYVDYDDFIRAEKADEKIGELLTVSNTYRTLVAVFVSVGVAALFFWLSEAMSLSQNAQVTLIAITLFVFFAFSFRKQVDYIRKRVEISKK